MGLILLGNKIFPEQILLVFPPLPILLRIGVNEVIFFFKRWYIFDCDFHDNLVFVSFITYNFRSVLKQLNSDERKDIKRDDILDIRVFTVNFLYLHNPPQLNEHQILINDLTRRHRRTET